MKPIKVFFLLILTNQLFAQTDSLSITLHAKRYSQITNNFNPKIQSYTPTLSITSSLLSNASSNDYKNKPFTVNDEIHFVNNHFAYTNPYAISPYSYLGYFVLGSIFQKASGQNFPIYIRPNCMEP